MSQYVSPGHITNRLPRWRDRCNLLKYCGYRIDETFLNIIISVIQKREESDIDGQKILGGRGECTLKSNAETGAGVSVLKGIGEQRVTHLSVKGANTHTS